MLVAQRRCQLIRTVPFSEVGSVLDITQGVHKEYTRSTRSTQGVHREDRGHVQLALHQHGGLRVGGGDVLNVVIEQRTARDTQPRSFWVLVGVDGRLVELAAATTTAAAVVHGVVGRGKQPSMVFLQRVGRRGPCQVLAFGQRPGCFPFLLPCLLPVLALLAQVFAEDGIVPPKQGGLATFLGLGFGQQGQMNRTFFHFTIRQQRDKFVGLNGHSGNVIPLVGRDSFGPLRHGVVGPHTDCAHEMVGFFVEVGTTMAVCCPIHIVIVMAVVVVFRSQGRGFFWLAVVFIPGAPIFVELAVAHTGLLCAVRGW